MPVEVEMVLRLLLVATLGAVIGSQREKAGNRQTCAPILSSVSVLPSLQWFPFMVVALIILLVPRSLG